MKTKFRSALAVGFISIFFALPVTSLSAANAGQKCSNSGALSGTKKAPLVCTQVAGKLVWRKSTKVSVPVITLAPATTAIVATTSSTSVAVTTLPLPITTTSTSTSTSTTTTTTTTTTTPPTTAPAAASNYITAGAFCAPAGSTGYSKTGTFYTCKTSDTDSRNRWRQ